jgi:hypothetical protein
LAHDAPSLPQGIGVESAMEFLGPDGTQTNSLAAYIAGEGFATEYGEEALAQHSRHAQHTQSKRSSTHTLRNAPAGLARGACSGNARQSAAEGQGCGSSESEELRQLMKHPCVYAWDVRTVPWIRRASKGCWGRVGRFSRRLSKR